MESLPDLKRKPRFKWQIRINHVLINRVRPAHANVESDATFCFLKLKNVNSIPPTYFWDIFSSRWKTWVLLKYTLIKLFFQK